MASVGTGSFKLHACQKDGVLEVRKEAIFFLLFIAFFYCHCLICASYSVSGS